MVSVPQIENAMDKETKGILGNHDAWPTVSNAESWVLYVADGREKFQWRSLLKTAHGSLHTASKIQINFCQAEQQFLTNYDEHEWHLVRTVLLCGSREKRNHRFPSQAVFHAVQARDVLTGFLNNWEWLALSIPLSFFKWLGVLREYIVKLLLNSDSSSAES